MGQDNEDAIELPDDTEFVRETELSQLPRKAYRVAEVQEMLGIGRNLAYELVADGTIRSVKAGRVTLVPADALDDYLSQ